MEILCSVCTLTLLKRVLNSKLNIESRSAVDLAHKIYGKKALSTPIIVLHGLLGSKRNWDSISKKLVEYTFRLVVAVDLRNHGESPHDSSHSYSDLASDVSQLMEKLSIPEAIIMGHSMGGRTGMVLALTEPSKVTSLIVVDISPINVANINDFFPRLIDVMREVEFPTGNIANVSNAKGAAKHKLITSGVVEEGSGALNLVLMNVGKRFDKKIGWLCNVDALKKHFADIASFPLDMVGKQYKGTTLFIAGQNSNYVPPSDLEKIRHFFPQAQLHYVAGVGHNVHAEDPDTFLLLVVKFMTQIK